MTDTTQTAPSPWLEFAKGLMPSLNQCLVIVVTATAGYYTAKLTAAPQPSRTVEIIKSVPDTGSTAQRVTTIESELKAFRQEFADFAARKGKRKSAIQPAK